MKNPHYIRVTSFVFGLRLRVALILIAAAAAFLTSGYGDGGFFPSA